MPKSSPTVKQSPPSQNIPIKPTVIPQAPIKQKNIQNPVIGELLRSLEDHSDSVYSVAISADGRTIVSGSDDNTIKVWNLATGELLRTLNGHSNSVSNVAISADSRT